MSDIYIDENKTDQRLHNNSEKKKPTKTYNTQTIKKRLFSPHSPFFVMGTVKEAVLESGLERNEGHVGKLWRLQKQSRIYE